MNSMENGLFDSHVHLQAYPADVLGRVLQRARAVGVTRFGCCGSSPADWGAVLRIAGEEDGVEPSIGLHPWFAGSAAPGWFDELGTALDQHPEAGIGEIGLDFTRDDPETQKKVFTRQLSLACEMKRRVTIHSVKADGALIRILSKHAADLPDTLVHAPSISIETWHELEKLGVYISIGSRVLHSSSVKARELAASANPERVRFETDSPYTCVNKCSVSSLGGINSPETLPLIITEVERLRRAVAAVRPVVTKPGAMRHQNDL